MLQFAVVATIFKRPLDAILFNRALDAIAASAGYCARYFLGVTLRAGRLAIELLLPNDVALPSGAQAKKCIN